MNSDLPADIPSRITSIKDMISLAREKYAEIVDTGVVLDDDSDESHLIGWQNAIAMYQAKML